MASWALPPPLLLLLLPLSATAAAAPPRPNIALVVVDDLGFGDVGWRSGDRARGGTGDIVTPTIDRLAAAGVKLGAYYVQPICSPTRTGDLTRCCCRCCCCCCCPCLPAAPPLKLCPCLPLPCVPMCARCLPGSALHAPLF